MTDAEEEYQLALPKTYGTIQSVSDWLSHRLNQRFVDRHLNLQANEIEWLEMDKYANVDYRLMVRTGFVGYFEVKTRRHVQGYYDLEKIPLRKYKQAQYYLNLEHKKTWYICRWVDAIGVFKLWEEPDEIGKQVARHDRGEKEDTYAFYDWHRAKTIINL